MTFIKEYLQNNNLEKLALVGANSQGKTYQLEQFAKENKGKVIFVESETKSDENMRNTATNTTLIEWITELVGIDDLNNVIDNIISNLNIKNNNDRVKVEIKNSLETYKGLIEFSVISNSNCKKSAGAGEKVLGQLLMIENMLNKENTKYEYLLIDEPESHLHPSLYVLISQTLKNISKRGIKVVIVTHSCEILKYFVENTNEIIRMNNLSPQPLKETRYYYQLKNQFNIYTNKDLFMDSYNRVKDKLDLYFNKIMLSQIYKSLFSDLVIIGEGIAEEEIFDMYINEYTSDYYNFNVSYIIAHGKELMTWYSKIFNELGIKVICIFDQDNEDSIKHKTINDTIKKETTDYIEISVSGKGHKNNKIENYLNINMADGDKGKYIITELRKLYINNDERLFELLKIIDDKIRKNSVY